MKKSIILTTMCAMFLLGACSNKKEKLSQDELEKRVEQFQKDEKNVLEKAKENEIFTKTFLFEKDESGVSQKQTITYKENQFLKLVVENTIPTSDELKKAIEEVGVEEAKKLLKESFFQAEDVKEVSNLSGFTIDIDLTSSTEYIVTSTYDFSSLDVQKVSNLEYFKFNKLSELVKNTPQEYIQNLQRLGAKEEK